MRLIPALNKRNSEMSLDSSGNEIHIAVEFADECSLETKELFLNLLNEILVYVGAGGEFLAGIWIVADNDLPAKVQELTDQFGISGQFIPRKIAPRGIALPLQVDDSLVCYIVIQSSLVRSIEGPGQYHPFDLVSTLLEELLHVHLFGSRWRKNGSLGQENQPPCRDELLVLCSNFHDECAVSALKTALLATRELTDHDGGLTPAQVMYGSSISALIDNAYHNLSQLVVRAAMGITPVAEAYNDVIAEIYRGIFEPLARDAGFRLGNSDAPHPNSNAAESRFFREHVEPFWEQIHETLLKSVHNEFVQTDSIVSQLADAVDSFLRHIGVETKAVKDGGCWVDFNTRFFDQQVLQDRV